MDARAKSLADQRAEHFLKWARNFRLGRAIFGTGVLEGHVVQVGGAASGVMTLQGNADKACHRCGAPANFRSDDGTKRGWPGAWVPVGDPRENRTFRDLGIKRCPNCDMPRPKPIPVRFVGDKRKLKIPF